jgi:hypothetical protein
MLVILDVQDLTLQTASRPKPRDLLTKRSEHGPGAPEDIGRNLTSRRWLVRDRTGSKFSLIHSGCMRPSLERPPRLFRIRLSHAPNPAQPLEQYAYGASGRENPRRRTQSSVVDNVRRETGSGPCHTTGLQRGRLQPFGSRVFWVLFDCAP